jgi:hypothetical protein
MGSERVGKLVLVGAIPPLMLKTIDNPNGTPIEVFDDLRTQVLGDRSQLFIHGDDDQIARSRQRPRLRPSSSPTQSSRSTPAVPTACSRPTPSSSSTTCSSSSRPENPESERPACSAPQGGPA